MLEFHQTADESAFHLRQHRSNILFFLIHIEKLALYCLVKRSKVRPAYCVPNRNEHVGSRLDQHPLIDSQIDLAVALCFVRQDSW